MRAYKHTILCVDDEEKILSALRRLLRGEDYRVITAASAKEGLSVLETNDVQVVISDQRMPSMSGTEFFATVRERFPAAIRIILSGYTDIDTITDSINKGHIYKFLLKPWNDETLKLEVTQALEYYELKYANKLLYETVLERNNQLKDVNDSLENMVKIRTEELEIKNRVLELSREILENMPVPIIGISKEGMIVMTNKRAEEISFAGRTVKVGEEYLDYFDDGLKDTVRRCLRKRQSQSLKECLIGERMYGIDITPLSGNISGGGVILSLTVNE